MNVSQEQNIIGQYLQTCNVLSEAVAGAGKTTTAEYIALTNPEDSILLLTYNKRLRLETQSRIEKKGILNLIVHNYHSFAVKHYHSSCHEDIAIKKHLRTSPCKTFKFTMIIIDEAQDMTELYYKLVLKIVDDNNYRPKFCILGDRRQSIYGFNGADERYISFGDQLFNFNSLPWQRCTLSKSFRVSKEHVDFINQCVLQNNFMKSDKITEKKPLYLLCDAFGKRPFLQVMHYLKSYPCNEIFVLSPSIRSEGSPVKKLANSLSSNGINIYMPLSDKEKLDEDIISNKLVFSSFHQVKGLERKVIIVFSFDKGYFDFCDRTSDPNKCPNTLYVALTRSLEHMTLIHHYQCKYLPFLNHKLLPQLCDCETVSDCIKKKSLNSQYIYKFNDKSLFDPVLQGYPTKVIDVVLNKTAKNIKARGVFITTKELCNNVNAEVIDQALTYCYISTHINSCMPGQIINIATKTNQNIINECVSEINEIAILSKYELLTTGKMTIVDKLKQTPFIKSATTDYFKEDSDEEDESSQTLIVPYEEMDIQNLLHISNQWYCTTNKILFKLKQISAYDWLLPEQLDKCMFRLRQLISDKAKYLQTYSVGGLSELRNRQLEGSFDCIDDKCIYKFICDKNISNKTILIHALNMYVYYLYHKIDIVKTQKVIDALIERTKLDKQIEQCLQHKIIIGCKLPILRKYGIECNYVKYINGFVNHLNRRKQVLGQIIRNSSETSFYLFNILTNEVLEISASVDQLRQMVDYIIQKKYYNNKSISDDDFIDKHKMLGF